MEEVQRSCCEEGVVSAIMFAAPFQAPAPPQTDVQQQQYLYSQQRKQLQQHPSEGARRRARQHGT